MCLYEDSIGADGYARTRHGGDEVRASAGYSRTLVRLLERMCHVENNRTPVFLHFRYAAVIYNEILIAEGCAALGNGNMVVAGIADFLHSIFHSFRR